MPPDERARAALRSLRRAFRAIAMLWLTTCLLFLAVNVIALLVTPVARSSFGTARRWFGYDAALKRVNPNLSPSELDQLIDESNRPLMYDAFTQFREKAFAGRYVNVDTHGFRVTKEQGPWPPSSEFFNVFLFGGSTTFGYGVADDQTIASKLYERLATAGLAKPPRVYNFGRGGYYSSQELVLLQRLLASGVVPDLAIFVDGLNDFFVADDRPLLTEYLEQQVQGMSQPPERPFAALVRSLPVTRLFGLLEDEPAARGGVMAPPPRPPVYDDPAVSEAVLHRYRANKALIEAMAAAKHVDLLFVWQPIRTYKFDLDPHPRRRSFGKHEYSRFGYPRIAEQVRQHPLGDDFVWCADIQEDVAELLYVDSVHYSPRMCAMVADCIFDALQRRRSSR